MKYIFFVIMITQPLFAQEIQLYQGKPPGSENWNWKENKNNKNRVNVMTVYNVSQPTLTVFKPDPAKANGTAVIICPGGGFHFLAIDHEGTNAARQLVKKGITVFVLKYRLVHIQSDSPFEDMLNTSDHKAWDDEATPIIPLAIQDGRNAIAYVRSHASEFAIKKDQIGIMGFSAGGLVAASTAFDFTPLTKPDFVVPVYADFGAERVGKITSQTPPMYILCTQDDEFGFAHHAINLYQKLTEEKRPAELHLLSKGGHGFGIGIEGTTTHGWLNSFELWLASRNLLN